MAWAEPSASQSRYSVALAEESGEESRAQAGGAPGLRDDSAQAPGRQRILFAATAAVLLVLAWVQLTGTGGSRGPWHARAAAVEAKYGAAECRSAVEGEQCYESVYTAMTTGRPGYVQQFKVLTEDSSFEDFQEFFFKEDPLGSGCTFRPCEVAEKDPIGEVFAEDPIGEAFEADPIGSGCLLAAPGEKCYEAVVWAMTQGLYQYTQRFQSLSEDSLFEDFQQFLFETDPTTCSTRPCQTQQQSQPFSRPTLFCWAVLRRDSYELSLMQEQYAQRAGIFGCDSPTLISDGDVGIPAVRTLTIGTVSSSALSKDGTTANSPIFSDAWYAIQADGEYERFDWIVKVDPDAVMVPWRLRHELTPSLQPENPYPVPYETDPARGYFVTNCDIGNSQYGKTRDDGWPMMYGAIEILSVAAARSYLELMEGCKGSHPEWQSFGEDAFLGLCLRQTVGAGEIFLRELDSGCYEGANQDCSDTSVQMYHPFKDAASWMQCWNQATASDRLD